MFPRLSPVLQVLAVATWLILPPVGTAAASTKERFQTAVRAVIQKYSAQNTEWGIAIRRADNGASLFEKKSLRLLVPASNRKLFTSVLSFEKMGSQYRYQTTLNLDGSINDRGHLHGNIRIEGSGDPTFLNPKFNGGKITGTLKEWVQKVKDSGVRYIHGNVVIDCSAFTPGYYQVQGLPDDYHLSYVARPSCVTINENCLALQINPGQKINQPAHISLYPPGSAVPIINRTKTTKARSVNTLRLTRPVDTDVISAEGRVPVGSKKESRLIAMRYPPRIVGNVFKQMLQRADIFVKGDVEVRYKKTARPGKRIAIHESPPLAEILKQVNRDSNNFCAEQIYQSISRRLKGLASYPATREIEKTYLDQIGVRVKDVIPEDGSGLSLKNRCTADSIVRLLSHARNQRYYKDFKSTLAVSGKSGTLRGRLGGKGLYGRIYAKTGTLDGVSCLSGYYFTPKGTPYVFSILVNQSRNGSAIAAQNKILEALVKYYSGT